LQFRRVLVDWISEIGERYRLNPTTVHVAVRVAQRAADAAGADEYRVM